MNDKPNQDEYDDAMKTAGVIPWLVVACAVSMLICALVVWVTGYNVIEFLKVFLSAL